MASRVALALRRAVAAALAAQGTLACGGKMDGDASCSIQRPDPIPTLACGQPYTVTISSTAACGIDGGALSSDQCNAFCTKGGTIASCELTSPTTIACHGPYCGKARTSLRRRRSRSASPLAAHLEDSVWLESASIDAFLRLERELAAHGSPRSLRRAARAAADDERRHTRAMQSLARRLGARTSEPRVRPRTRTRPLVSVAIENAVEGCVHETFGAAMARLQSMTARDAGVRRVMRAIARDEARHAVLAANVARWTESRLSRSDQGRVRKARDRAVRAMRAALVAPPPRTLVDTLGMPTRAQAEALLTELTALLW